MPCNYGQTVTLVGALGLHGLVAAMSVEGPTDTDVFLVFLTQVLLPRVRPGDVVVMDQLGVHRVGAVESTVRAAGTRLLYLLPSSPDFNPMEPCWGKLKACLRAAAARTRQALDAAIHEAVASVTANDARGWLQHCGYVLHF